VGYAAALALALLLVAAVMLGWQKVIDVELKGEVDKGLKDAVVGLKVLQVVVIAAAMGVVVWGVLTHQPISQLASSRWAFALFTLAAIIVALQVGICILANVQGLHAAVGRVRDDAGRITAAYAP